MNGVGSSATINGNTLTLTLNTTFDAGFAGNRMFYLAARDISELNNTGWLGQAGDASLVSYP